MHRDLLEYSALAPIEVCLETVVTNIMTIACDIWTTVIRRQSKNGVSGLARLAGQALSSRLGYSTYAHVR